MKIKHILIGTSIAVALVFITTNPGKDEQAGQMAYKYINGVKGANVEYVYLKNSFYDQYYYTNYFLFSTIKVGETVISYGLINNTYFTSSFENYLMNENIRIAEQEAERISAEQDRIRAELEEMERQNSVDEMMNILNQAALYQQAQLYNQSWNQYYYNY